MKIDEGLDTGPVVAERSTAISGDDTGGSLTARLAHIGASLVDDTLPGYLSGSRTPVPQIFTGASHAAKLSKAEARMLPNMSVQDADRMVRAFAPRPGAWVATDHGSIRILGATLRPGVRAEPGVIASVGADVVLGCADGALSLTLVQPEGRQVMSAAAWMNGRRGEAVRLTEG
jgi:methionyl-tRNA formyltransferase